MAPKIFKIHDFFIEFELKQILQYYNEMEKYNQNSLQSYEEYLDEATQGMDKEEAQYYVERNDDKLYDYVIRHPQMIRRTVFLEIYFSFENYLNSKCNDLQKEKNLNLSYEDIHGHGINRAKTFLTKACLITEPFNTGLWRDIVDYGKVRNAIAHNQSIVKKKKYSSIKQLPGLSVEHEIDEYTFSFILEENFVPKCIDTITEFVKILR
ncbi:hypothetical protein NSQ76_06425 [Bacillus sp. FSL M8-0256]|uniref:hypothetical protein n=1 Tax=Bacillus sp. FSL M8-0256 TaxID=2954578 RepID=UPI0030F79554